MNCVLPTSWAAVAVLCLWGTSVPAGEVHKLVCKRLSGGPISTFVLTIRDLEVDLIIAQGFFPEVLDILQGARMVSQLIIKMTFVELNDCVLEAAIRIRLFLQVFEIVSEPFHVAHFKDIFDALPDQQTVKDPIHV